MNQINFLPQSFRRKQARRRRLIRDALFATMLSVLLAAWWLAQAGQTATVRRYAESLEARVLVAHEEQIEIVRLRDEYKVLSQRVELQRELSQSISQTQVLAQLAELMPPSIGTTRLEVVTRRPAPASRADAARAGHGARSTRGRGKARKSNQIHVTFEGIAADDLEIAAFVAALSDCPLFENVYLNSSRADERNGLAGRRFRFTTVVPLNRRFLPAAEGEVSDGL